MSRHIADQPRTRSSARLTAFLRQERAALPHSTTLHLQSRPKARADNATKAAHYLRIARGRQA